MSLSLTLTLSSSSSFEVVGVVGVVVLEDEGDERGRPGAADDFQRNAEAVDVE